MTRGSPVEVATELEWLSAAGFEPATKLLRQESPEAPPCPGLRYDDSELHMDMRRRFEPRNSGSRVKYLLLLSHCFEPPSSPRDP